MLAIQTQALQVHEPLATLTSSLHSYNHPVVACMHIHTYKRSMHCVMHSCTSKSSMHCVISHLALPHLTEPLEPGQSRNRCMSRRLFARITQVPRCNISGSRDVIISTSSCKTLQPNPYSSALHYQLPMTRSHQRTPTYGSKDAAIARNAPQRTVHISYTVNVPGVVAKHY
jgi:hypothetical protein